DSDPALTPGCGGLAVEDLADAGGEGFDGFAITREQAGFAVFVEDVYAAAVGDFVVVGVVVLGRLDLEGDAVAAGQVGHLLFGAREPDGMAVEGVDIGLQRFGGVAVRVDADEQNADIVGLGAE